MVGIVYELSTTRKTYCHFTTTLKLIFKIRPTFFHESSNGLFGLWVIHTFDKVSCLEKQAVLELLVKGTVQIFFSSELRHLLAHLIVSRHRPERHL